MGFSPESYTFMTMGRLQKPLLQPALYRINNDKQKNACKQAFFTLISSIYILRGKGKHRDDLEKFQSF